MLTVFNRAYPAPLKLCFISAFDLVNDTHMCPTERNALKEFYDSAKGNDWTKSDYWMDPHIGHCDWHGIKCNIANNTFKLELQSNILSGNIAPNLGKLSSLEVLDLNNNNIKVRIAF